MIAFTSSIIVLQPLPQKGIKILYDFFGQSEYVYLYSELNSSKGNERLNLWLFHDGGRYHIETSPLAEQINVLVSVW